MVESETPGLPGTKICLRSKKTHLKENPHMWEMAIGREVGGTHQLCQDWTEGPSDPLVGEARLSVRFGRGSLCQSASDYQRAGGSPSRPA